MSASYITNKSKGLWIHDRWVALISYYLLEYFEEDARLEKFSPIQQELIQGLENGVHNFLPGALDMGLDVIISKGYEKEFIEVLIALKGNILAKGSYISEEENRKIESLSYQYREQAKIPILKTQRLIEIIDEVIELLQIT